MRVSVNISRRESSDTSTHECFIDYEDFSENGHQFCRMNLHSQILGDFSATEFDIFECLLRIRKLLEAKGWFVLCKGASVSVYITGMSRNMTGGYILYQKRLGEDISRKDKVKLFDPATLDEVGTVDEQLAFHQRWVSSIREIE